MRRGPDALEIDAVVNVPRILALDRKLAVAFECITQHHHVLGNSFAEPGPVTITVHEGLRTGSLRHNSWVVVHRIFDFLFFDDLHRLRNLGRQRLIGQHVMCFGRIFDFIDLVRLV